MKKKSPLQIFTVKRNQTSESLSSTYNETLQTTVDVKVKKEEGEQQHNDCPLESKSFQTDALRAVFDGQLMMTSEFW